MEQTITEFYYRSLTSDWKGFDWQEAFELFEHGLQQKLDEHGQGTFEAYQELMEGIYGDIESCIPEELTIRTDYVSFTAYDAAQAIMEAQYEKMQDTFSDTFSDLQDMLDKMQDTSLSIQDKIELFDSVIHAQHVCGDIFEDIDSEDLKHEAEEMLKEVA